ncbi:MAG: alpha/beta hydrolase [Thermoflexales bacterium]
MGRSWLPKQLVLYARRWHTPFALLIPISVIAGLAMVGGFALNLVQAQSVRPLFLSASASSLLPSANIKASLPPRLPLAAQRAAKASAMSKTAAPLAPAQLPSSQPTAAQPAQQPAAEPAPPAPQSPWGVQQATCPDPSSQLLTETLESRVTVVPIVVHVLLPPCYDPAHYAYPTLYLIHGTAYEQGGWLVHGIVELSELQMGLGMLPPFIIVMPGADMRAGTASRYSWTNGGDQSYDAFFVQELMPFVEERFSTWRTREGRAIGGISRGGYWSVEIGFAHPDLFDTIGGHSPSVHSMLVGVPPDFSMLYWAQSIEALRQKRIWIDAGDRDWARVDARKLADDLAAQNIPFQLSFGDGNHEDAYWTSRLAEYLAFYSATWPHQPRPIATP